MALHPLVAGESRTHAAGDDAVNSAKVIGPLLDARVAALGPASTRADLLELIRDIGAAETHAGPWPGVTAWARTHFATIKARAVSNGLAGLGIWDDA